MSDLTDATGLAADPLAESSSLRKLRETVRTLVRDISPEERVLQLDEDEVFDQELFAALGAEGLTALGGDASLGGSGDIREQAVVIEELAAGPTSLAVYMVVHYMGVHILSTYGTSEQREQWLKPLMAGSAKVSFALTEPGGGTDIARAMRTVAEETPDGWRINGHKRWIGGSNTADVILLLARSAPVSGSSIDGITMFAVPGGTPGVQASVLPTVSIRGFDTTEIHLTDVAVDAGAVIGSPGSGLRQVLSTLNRERINAASGALGAGTAALRYATDYARSREAFGSTLGAFQAVQHRLVDGAMALEAARSLLVRAAAVEAAGGRADLLSSMAKVTATEAAVKVTQDGMETLGGVALSRTSPMQRWFRDVRLWVFAPVANDMLRNNLGQRLLDLPRSF
ncbi:MAG TPA: acyl-CoA dehydrogenase family protein [Phototrophicaceae bacterium]|nr:acyl-CoA dehydrogenase family protein [Phototrophicaceae bacterium]